MKKMTTRLTHVQGELDKLTSNMQQAEHGYRTLADLVIQPASDRDDTACVNMLFELLPHMLKQVNSPQLIEINDRKLPLARYRTAQICHEMISIPAIASHLNGPRPGKARSGRGESLIGLAMYILPIFDEGRWQVAVISSGGTKLLIDPWGLEGSSHAMV